MENEELLKEIARLNQLVKDLEDENEQLVQQNEKLLVETRIANERLNEALLMISNYQEKYNIERTRAFIPKTERLDSIVINEAEEVIREEGKNTKRGRRYRKRAFDYERYVTETRVIEPDEDVCPTCGSRLIDASEKIRYVVEIEKAKIKVIKLIKKSRKCPSCNKKDNRLYYPISNEVFPNSILTPSFASYLIYHKYELGIPFEHLSRHITNSIGFEISKQDIANYMARSQRLLHPIYEKMKEDLLNNGSKVIHSDETTLTISKKEDDARKKSYVYVYTSSFYDKNQIRIYDFHESRSIEATRKWLNDFNGYIVCDNYPGYNVLKKGNEGIRLQKCWAHVRRRFADIVKNLAAKDRKKSRAYQILQVIGRLFDLERKYKASRLTPRQIKEARHDEVPPIRDQLRSLIDSINPLPDSALDSAIKYMKDCWPDLFTYLLDGCIEMTNNTAERAVKPFVIQRKVFQTSGSYAGAKMTGEIFSIVQTCLLNGIDVERYIEYVLGHSDDDHGDLLPYSENIQKLLKIKSVG